MSRTFKDRPTKIQHPNSSYSFDKSDQPKIAKNTDSDWHWTQCTPSWWVREFMTVPQRAASQIWSVKAVQTAIEDLEDLDKPNYSRKPHKYYW